MSAVVAEKSNRTDPLRIALLGYRSNPFSGGQGIYIKYLAEALAGLGHRVDVISGQPYPDLDLQAHSNLQLIKLPGLNLFEHNNPLSALRLSHLGSLADFSEWLSMVTGGFGEPFAFGRRAASWLAEHRDSYDIVHDNQSLAWGLLRIQDSGLPLISTIHHPITMDRDIALADENRWHYRLLIRRWHYFLRMQTQVVRKLQNLVTVSENSRQDIANAFGITTKHIDLVYNGIDIDTFRRQPDGVRERDTLITTASADQPLKGSQHLLRAMAELLPKHPNLRLIMIGKPKPGGKTDSLIKSLDLTHRIELHHGISTQSLVSLYGRASIAVVPSEYEGFGLPAAEAMACGVPVVSSDGGALPEVVGDAGIIVEAGNYKPLAREISALLGDDTARARLAHAGRQRIEKEFTWNLAATRMTDIYRRVINERQQEQV
ncbi:MAG: glycosyltransferase family 4 protein [Pseudomonadaceae bacterium]|nr:glycosyltransferase family 4 protein [Pseudomonadaceae bacterium]